MGEAKIAEHKERADRLWEVIRPGLEAFAEECRGARYTMWGESGEHLARIRKVPR
jgi:hypothetical protein